MSDKTPTVHAAARLALFAALLLGACDEPAPEEATPDPPTSTRLEDGGIRLDDRARPFVTVEAVGNNTSGVILRVPARVAFRDNAISRVGSPIPARVMQLHVQVGDLVHVDDALATLASPDASRSGDGSRSVCSIQVPRGLA